MGEALYAQLSQDRPELAYRTYAPVGSHRDLLAYLVRRLLENGANSSFVALAADESVPVAALVRHPAEIIGTSDNARHQNIPLPRDLFGSQRQNSRGVEFGERASLEVLLAAIRDGTWMAEAAPLLSRAEQKLGDHPEAWLYLAQLQFEVGTCSAAERAAAHAKGQRGGTRVAEECARMRHLVGFASDPSSLPAERESDYVSSALAAQAAKSGAGARPSRRNARCWAGASA